MRLICAKHKLTKQWKPGEKLTIFLIMLWWTVHTVSKYCQIQVNIKGKIYLKDTSDLKREKLCHNCEFYNNLHIEWMAVRYQYFDYSQEWLTLFTLKIAFYTHSPRRVYPRDVTQVEKIVDFCGCWQETLDNSCVQLYCGLSHDVSNGLYFFFKVLQFLVDHTAKYSFDLGLL